VRVNVVAGGRVPHVRARIAHYVGALHYARMYYVVVLPHVVPHGYCTHEGMHRIVRRLQHVRTAA
jgi:hypothetical protein